MATKQETVDHIIGTLAELKDAQDKAWLTEFVGKTAEQLPAPKFKK